MLWPAAASAALLLATMPVFGQTPPDAGSLMRDLDRPERQQIPQTLPPPEAPPPPEPTLEKVGDTVFVRDFRIRATQFPEAMLRGLLDDYVGRELTLGHLQEAALRIGRHYREEGYLGRAYIPRQTIQDGIVEIVVLEGRLGEAVVDPASMSRLLPGLATAIVEHRAPRGEVLNLRRLQEGVTILGEIPGVGATASLRPGAEEGETVADLVLTDTALVSAQVRVDNESPRYVGRRRAIGELSLNNPWGRGERLSVTALASRDSRYGRLAAQIPAGSSGLTVGAHASYLEYELGAPFDVLDQRGHAYTFGGFSTYPVMRRPTLALTGLAGFEHRRLVNDALGENLDDRTMNVGTFGLAFATADSWFGGGLNDGSVTAAVGHLDRGGNPADLAIDMATARTHGHYGTFAINAARLQRLGADTDLHLRTSAQLAATNLDSSEKFSLGGPSGVRAYPPNEANGDHGFLFTAEIRHRLPHSLRLFGFYDLGGIVQHVKPWEGWQPVSGQPNRYLLHGAGAGVGWSPLPAIRLQATYAHAIGRNPGHDARGHNADGRADNHQLWVRASLVM